MPELPEVEITARLLDDALRGAAIVGARALGVNTLKTFEPPLSALVGARVTGVSRRGKHLIVESDQRLALLVHVMSAGRLQLYGDAAAGAASRAPASRARARGGGDRPADGDGRASGGDGRMAGKRDRALRLQVTFADGRELRLRELGSRQAAWARLVHAEALPREEALAKLGPEAWPDPPPLGPLLGGQRPLHALLRDQRVIAGIGRSWADEVLWEARLSPYKRGSDLIPAEADALRSAIVRRLGEAIAHYERRVRVPIPHKLPAPLLVHGRAGAACARGNGTLAAVHFEDHVIAYCPACQTGGRVLKDRRLSRLLR